MAMQSASERLVAAAFELFDERGYDQTTVEEIAERAGVARSTFFRYYGSKEGVLFPDHDRLMDLVRDRLSTATRTTMQVALAEAARLVLANYLDEGDRARRRYALTSALPALRDREIAGAAQYQRLFREFVAEWLDESPSAPLRANLIAASVVAAHNYVLRRWLRGETADPLAEFDEAMSQALDHASWLGSGSAATGSPPGATVIVLRSGLPFEAVADLVREAIPTEP